MHFYMHPYLHKKNYSCKKWVLHIDTWEWQRSAVVWRQ
jgi:hypothetical protein